MYGKEKSILRLWKRAGTLFLAAALTVTAVPAVSLKEAKAAAVVVVLDPGHGGGEAGAYGQYNKKLYKEEVLNWKIAEYTKEALDDYSGLKVYMTRTENQYKNLEERVAVAKKYKADLLVSLHLNSASDKTVKGGSVLISRGTYRSYLHNKEKKFGTYVLNELTKLGIAKRFPETGGMEYRMSENGSHYPNGGVRDYYGIVAQSVEANLPGVIIEHTFISNPDEIKKYLSTDAKLKKIGEADAKAIANYFNLKKKEIDTEEEKETVKPGWEEEGDDYYYRKSDGTYAKGWLTLGSRKYYLDSKGRRVTGWKKISGSWYNFRSNGTMRKGWYKEGKSYFYMDESGKRLQGLQTIDGKTYYFSPKSTTKYRLAARVTGWRKVKGNYYYFMDNGQAATGWKKINGAYYRMDKKGKMMTGWTTYKGKHYYLFSLKSSSRGQRAENRTLTLGGKKYRFNSKGVCTNYKNNQK